MENKLITAEAAAEHCHVSVKTIRQACADRSLRSVYSKQWLTTIAWCDEWMASRAERRTQRRAQKRNSRRH